LGDDLGRLIDKTQEEGSKAAGFRDGLTILVSCGIGRATEISLEKKKRTGWRVEFLSVANLVTLSWLPEMAPLFLWKLHEAYERLTALGVVLQNMNGLLNLVAWVRSQNGHLVPHGAVPEEFGADGTPNLILIEQNGLRRLRQEAATSWDARVVQNVRGDWIKVRKPDQSQFKEDLEKPLYASEERVEGRWPLGVYLTDARPWWCELEVAKGTGGYFIFQRWQMITMWLGRAAPVLDKSLGKLPGGPLLWKVKFEGEIGDIEGDLEPVGYEEAKAEIAVSVSADDRTVVMVVSPRFEPANFNARNVAERAIVTRFIDGFAELAGEALSPDQHTAMLVAIVPNDQARQTHMFRAKKFLDRVGSSVPRTPITIDTIDTIDAATPKLGLGRRVRDRKLGGDIDGKKDCAILLNATVAILEDDLCADLRKFDRQETIMLALRNHESAAIDLATWMRTASAVLSLHNDQQAAADTIALHEYRLNAVSLATRLLVEFALCECPLEGGLKPGELDLGRLMAKAVSLPALGGWSDAIRWDAMEPVLKIRPLGDIHAKAADFEEIVASYGRAGTDLRLSDAVERYPRNLDPVEARSSLADMLDPAFLAAWQEEFGASVDDVRRFIDCIEDLGADKEQAVLKVRKSQLAALKLGDKPLPPEPTAAIVEALTLKSRPKWRDVPAGFDERDRQPWRFRRRLSVLRKPLIQIDDHDDPTILVAPGILRTGFVYTLGGFERGDFPAWQLKPLMRSWMGASSDRRGKEFNAEVAARLTELGWSVEAEVPITKLFGKGFDRNYGDVDVLAWRLDLGRVLIVECKDVQYRKTFGEIAEQLADFRGELDANGRPDYLLRHLNRIDVISRHIAEVKRYVKMQMPPKIESHLVFKHPVPMRFALKRMEERVSVHLLSELADI
jgi:hypothetical protein